MSRLNKIRIRNAVVVAILYAEAWYQAFINTAMLHSSGRVQGIFIGLNVIFLFLLIGLPIAEYQKTRNIHKSLNYLKNFILILFSFEIVIKNVVKRSVFVIAMTVILLAVIYNLLYLVIPSIYDRDTVLIFNVLGIVSALATAFVVGGDLMKGKKVFKITDIQSNN